MTTSTAQDRVRKILLAAGARGMRKADWRLPGLDLHVVGAPTASLRVLERLGLARPVVVDGEVVWFAAENAPAASPRPRGELATMSVAALGLELRAQNSLDKADCHTVLQLTGMTSGEILKLPWSSVRMLTRIRTALANQGLALAGEVCTTEPAAPAPTEEGART